MKRKRQSPGKLLDQFFEPSRKLPAVDVEQALERLLDRRRDNLEGVFEGLESASHTNRIEPPKAARHRLWMTAAAALLVAVTLSVMLWPRNGPAVVETVEGGLYRLNQGTAESLRVNERLDSGETVRANGGSGGTLVLADGSRVEMRSQSELSLENADDGIRINLKKGSIIVNAAKQRAGHLYVQTKDMTVSVVGTVFLVNAEEEGSRIAVIEGEVRVQQGSTEKKLQPGDQVTTSPKLETLPMKEEVAWSRQADAHMALLQRAITPSVPRQSKEMRLAFEEASVRPKSLASGGGRGGGGNSVLPDGCTLASSQVDPSRFAVSGVTLYTLVGWAYGANFLNPLTAGCSDLVSQGLISGGPGWSRSDLWDVEAVIPAGMPGYTEQQLRRGEAPNLKRMLLTLLEDRFKIMVRHDKKEVAAHALVLEQGGPKFTVPRNDTFPMGIEDPKFKGFWEKQPSGRVVRELGATWGKDVSMADLVSMLPGETGGTVVDRTGFAGQFSFMVQFQSRSFPFSLRSGGPSIFTALEEQVGLKLEPIQTTVEAWVIEQAEKPSEN